MSRTARPSKRQIAQQAAAPAPTKAQLTQELAGPRMGTVRSPWGGHPAAGLTASRLASIIREAQGGDHIRLFELSEEIEERFCHYASVLGTRRRAVAGLELQINAAGEDDATVEHADFIRDWLTRDELQIELFDILDAIGKGFSITEIIWASDGKHIYPDKLAWRDPRWFEIDPIDGVTLRYREGGALLDLPQSKFVLHNHPNKSGIPVRSGLVIPVAWRFLFSTLSDQAWALFLETFGQPMRLGKYPAGSSSEDRDALFNAVQAIGSDWAGIVPSDMQIEFVQAASMGAADSFEKRQEWIERSVSKLVLGQTATTDAIAGGHAVGQEHNDVRGDITRSDAKLLCATINKQIIKPIIDLNFGVQFSYPKARLPDDEISLDRLVAAVQVLVPLGLRVSEPVLRDKLGLPDPGEDECLGAPEPAMPEPAAPVAPAEPVQPDQPTPDIATQAQQRDVIDEAVDRLVSLSSDLPGAALQAVVDAGQRASDWPAFVAALRTVEPTAEPALVDRLRRAGFAAHLHGREGFEL